MQLLTTLSPIAAPGGSAVALGFFDGVHLGHRAVLAAAARAAAAQGLTAAAFTFTLPAGAALKGGRILPQSLKHARIAAQGIEQCLEPPFDAFYALSPRAFVEQILVGCFRAKAVFCGDNFTFGARAAGDVVLLRELCAVHGIAVQVVEMAQYAGEPVSSTRIRAALDAGDMELAHALLGDPYAVDWPVVRGQGLGHTLGVPTLNQNYPAGMLLPCSGVYLTRARLGGRWYPGATGIGPRPTVAQEGAPITCETYLPGYAGDAYGLQPPLEFYRRLGPIRKFDTLAGLRACILDAARQSERYFSEKVPKNVGAESALPPL